MKKSRIRPPGGTGFEFQVPGGTTAPEPSYNPNLHVQYIHKNLGLSIEHSIYSEKRFPPEILTSGGNRVLTLSGDSSLRNLLHRRASLTDIPIPSSGIFFSSPADEELFRDKGSHGSILGLQELPKSHSALRIARKSHQNDSGEFTERTRDFLKMLGKMSILEELKDMLGLWDRLGCNIHGICLSWLKARIVQDADTDYRDGQRQCKHHSEKCKFLGRKNRKHFPGSRLEFRVELVYRSSQVVQPAVLPWFLTPRKS